MDAKIIHDPEGGEFYCLIEGSKSFLSYYDDNPDYIDIYHTYVPTELRNRGIAQQLIAEAIKYTEKSGKKIISTCSFADMYFAKHPELKGLLYNNKK